MIVTFYSYKGGVGRSMALANVADILCRGGARVLMVDFDLEAPGLEQYFEVPQASARAHEGLIDLLAAFKEAMAVGGARHADFKDLDRFILPIYQKLSGDGSLHLMPAGKREGADLERYATAVRSFDWQDFYFNWEGELFFEWLRDQLTSDRYDLVLVDSRTGVTEMGGICSYQLADQIVMFCAANKQNLRGTQNVIDDFTSARVMARRGDRPLDIVVVPARIEQRDPALLDEFLREFEATFARYSPGQLRAAGLGASALMIPYQPELAFEERVVTDPARGAHRNEIAVAFLDLARAVTLLAPAGSRVAELSRPKDPNAAPTPQYDVASRFGGYDVHLAGSATIREDLEQLKRGLDRAGVEVFLDPIEPVPSEEWQRRSEQILFHSLLLLLVGSELTSAQQQALKSLLRANRGAKARPVRLVTLRGARDSGLARALELDTEAKTLAEGPDDPGAAGELVALIRSSAATRTGERVAPRMSAPPPAPPPSPGSAPAPPAQGPSPTVAASHPFRGADPFREQEAGYFFGRERLVADLVSAIEAHQRVWLLGPSGSGKTSAVLAGAFPALRSVSTSRVLERVTVGPGFLAGFAAALERIPRDGGRHVLFVDDFEQALELPPAERDAIFEAVTHLETTRREVVILIGACEDRIGSFRAPPLSLDSTAPATIQVSDFTTGELRAAIERPAERGGLAYEPGLVDRILTDAGLQASAIRLVQTTLSRLWESRREGWLTNAAYERIGGISAVVGEIADAALARCSSEPAVLDRILSRLIALDTSTPPSAPPVLRRRLSVPLAELLPADGDDHPYRNAIRELTFAGLLVARANNADAPCVELIHDSALARSSRLGERLEKLVVADQEFLLWRQRLGEGIAREEGLMGNALRTARGWLKSRASDLSADERRAIVRATRVNRALVATAIVVFAVIAVLVYREQRQDRVDAAVAAVTAADELATRRQWTAAIENLDAAYERYPFRDSLLLKRGRAHAGLGDDTLAVADFTAALALNPGLTDALVERAAAYFEAGDYTRAMANYDELIRRDMGVAGAYFGRAVARDRLRGDADSTLADFAAAFKADSTRLDALFESASLNQRLGRRTAAVRDFQRFLALSTNPNDREAAQTRLRALAPRDTSITTVRPSPQPTPVAKTTVYLHYADPGDSSAVSEIAREMARAKTLRVPPPQLSDRNLTVAELRYVSADERFAKDVLAITDGALAKVGYRSRLEPRVLDPKRFPNARAGRLEVWLPPLSRSLYSAPQKY